MPKKEIKDPNILSAMQHLLELAKNRTSFKVREIFEILAGKGYPVLLIIFSLPFCLPVQIPGFSTPFGIMLAFLGLRMAFAQAPWWPQWILKKELKSQSVETMANKTIQTIQFLKKVIHPRLSILATHPLAIRLHGLLICLLAILLSLPLPIPFSNMLAASPIFLIGLGLLEEDGLMIIIGDSIALLCFFAFFGLYLLTKAQFSLIFLCF